jgi:hypothetical protein
MDRPYPREKWEHAGCSPVWFSIDKTDFLYLSSIHAVSSREVGSVLAIFKDSPGGGSSNE